LRATRGAGRPHGGRHARGRRADRRRLRRRAPSGQVSASCSPHIPPNDSLARNEKTWFLESPVVASSSRRLRPRTMRASSTTPITPRLTSAPPPATMPRSALPNSSAPGLFAQSPPSLDDAVSTSYAADVPGERGSRGDVRAYGSGAWQRDLREHRHLDV